MISARGLTKIEKTKRMERKDKKGRPCKVKGVKKCGGGGSEYRKGERTI
jgi:hypothetical protein